MESAKTVESYIGSKKEWEESLILLRELLDSTSLEETIKWGLFIVVQPFRITAKGS